MADWQSTRTRGVYIAHQRECPALGGSGARCRCRPSWCGRRRNPVSGEPEWQKPVVKDRSEVLAWLAAGEAAREHAAEAGPVKRFFEEIGDQWLAGVESGRVGRRRGRGKPYSETTIDGYRRCYRYSLRPQFGPQIAEDISEFEWQACIDSLSVKGLSRSRIAGQVAVASAIYAWALTPTRRLVTRNPLRLVELPPSDEKPRLRVPLADEAAALLAALEPEDAVPYALAMYAGLRPLGDRPPGVARPARRRADRQPRPRREVQERGRHGAAPADRRAAARRPAARLAAPGPPRVRARARTLGHVGQGFAEAVRRSAAKSPS